MKRRGIITGCGFDFSCQRRRCSHASESSTDRRWILTTLCLLLSFTHFHLLPPTIQIYSLPPGVMAYKEKTNINKRKGSMLNIFAGITLCFLNVLFFPSKCFGIYLVIIYVLILIYQIWNTHSKYDCLLHFALWRLINHFQAIFSFLENTNFCSFLRGNTVFLHSFELDSSEYNNTIHFIIVLLTHSAFPPLVSHAGFGFI